MGKIYRTPLTNNVKRAPFGAILGTALNLGQQVGAMMPDNTAGNVLSGVFDPMKNLGAGLSYMTEGKIGKGLLSLVPGVGTYLQGKDQDEAEAKAKATMEATKKAMYLDNMKQSSQTDMMNYTPTNQVSMYADGGVIKTPADYNSFLAYSKTAPENRQPGPDWVYGDPKQYDHYGMWDALGKPSTFDEALAKNPDWKPNEQDGMYHGFSTNPNTGVWLKAHTPGTTEPGSTAWMEHKEFMLSGDKNWNSKKKALVFDTDLQRMRYLDKTKDGTINHNFNTQDGVIKHMRNGGTINSLPATSDFQFGNFHLNSNFTPSRINLVKGVGQTGKWKTPAGKGAPMMMGLDALISLGAMVNDEYNINTSSDPKAARKQVEYRNAKEREKIKSNDAQANAMYPDYMPNGGNISSLPSPMGSRQINLPTSGNPMTQGATQVTTSAGSTAGYHEDGKNIPIVNQNGQTTAIAEPGEVVVNEGDQSIILTKRHNDLAQQYTALDNQLQNINGKIAKAKSPEARAGLNRSAEYLKMKQQEIVAQQKQLTEQMQPQGQVPVADGGLVLPNTNYGWGNQPTIPTFNVPQYNMVGNDAQTESVNLLNTTQDNNQSSNYTEPIDSTPFDWNKGLGIASDVAGMILPSMMNYKNQKLMRDSMEKIANQRPILNKMNYIQPNYQIGDQVASANNSYATMNEIAGKVSNPLTAASILASAGVDRAQTINSIMGEKNRADDQINYRNSMMNNQVTAQNNAIINADSNMKLESQLSLNNAQINLNNTTVKSIYSMIQEGNLKERDKQTMQLAIQELNQYGVVGRKLGAFLKANGISVKIDENKA